MISRVSPPFVFGVFVWCGLSVASASENIARSQCFEIRAETAAFSGTIVGAARIQWSIEVIGDGPFEPPSISIAIDGHPVESGASSFQSLEDTEFYSKGAMKFGSYWFSRDLHNKVVEIAAVSSDRIECSVRLTVTAPMTPDLVAIDRVLMSSALEDAKKKRELEAEEPPSSSEETELREALRKAVAQRLAPSWFSAVEERRQIVDGELFREFVYLHDGIWDISAFGSGAIDSWKADARHLHGAVADMYQRMEVIDQLDALLACSVMKRYAGSVAKYGPSAALTDALSTARDLCSGFPVSLQMLKGIDLVVHGESEKNLHGWIVAAPQ